MPAARRPSTRGLTLRSLLALAVLTLLAGSNYVIMRDYTRAGELHSAVINACGRQRMLVERVGLLAQQLGFETDPEEKSILRGALRDAVKDMETSHAGLVHDRGESAFPVALPEKARAIFFQPPADLDRRLHSYLDDARSWSNTPEEKLTPHQPLLRRLMATASEKTLLQALEHFTHERQKDAEGHLAGLKRRNGWVLGSTLAVLLLTALFVFLPTIRRLDREVRDIERSEAHSRAIVDTAVDGIIIIDEHGTIHSVNPAARTLFGYDTPEMVGRNVKMLMPEPMHTEHDDYVRRYVETGHAKIIGIGREVVGRRKSGEIFPLDLAVSEMRAEGKRMFLGILRDITARKRAEEALRESEERLARVMENLPGVAFTKDAQGRYVYVNPHFEKTFHVTLGDLAGKTDDEFWPPEAAAQFKRNDRRVLETNRPLQVVEEVPHDDGPHHWLVTKYPIADRSGVPIFIGGLAIDISERRRAEQQAHHLEEQLRHSQKMEALGRLAGGIAHDFNNLMTTVTGYSELLLDRLGESDPLRKYVEEIKGDGERATALTRQLLALSRRQVAEPREIELSAIVSNMENMLRRIIGEDVELHSSLRAGSGHIRADAGQVEQVVMNLVVNARDAMPQGGKLSIEARNMTLDSAYAAEHAGVRAGRYVMLAISDTGVGMTREVQSHLFEPFFTTKERGKGTGLGLSIVYGIVNQYGGHIGVYSEPGRGTTFKLFWPEVSADQPASAPMRAGERRQTGEETILLVEDEHRVRGLAKEILERHGYRIIEASGPAEALSLAGDHSGEIHLLLTDVVMPQMNGRELAGRLAVDRPAMRILYMSGYTDDSIVQQGVLAAGTPFLQKPFTAAGLTAKVREVLDSLPRSPGTTPSPPPRD
ncbi:MAG: PAS domain S-box protein [Nitrospirae bacterium]|nr:PAS domain S-box protein [Nitrospirota bacterium]